MRGNIRSACCWSIPKSPYRFGPWLQKSRAPKHQRNLPRHGGRFLFLFRLGDLGYHAWRAFQTSFVRDSHSTSGDLLRSARLAQFLSGPVICTAGRGHRPHGNPRCDDYSFSTLERGSEHVRQLDRSGDWRLPRNVDTAPRSDLRGTRHPSSPPHTSDQSLASHHGCRVKFHLHSGRQFRHRDCVWD